MNSDQKSKENKPDWVAIILQFLLGALIGGGAVFYAVLRYGFGRGIESPFVMVCALAGALMLGSVGALFGDDAWDVSYRVIPNMSIHHSRGSRLFFTIIMIIAAIMPLIYCLLKGEFSFIFK